jgi:hypothetical protein
VSIALNGWTVCGFHGARYRTVDRSPPALRKGIERVSSVKEACAADGEKSFHLAQRLGNRAVRLAGLKLAPKLNKGAIGLVDAVCQYCSNITNSDRIL